MWMRAQKKIFLLCSLLVHLEGRGQLFTKYKNWFIVSIFEPYLMHLSKYEDFRVRYVI